MSNPIVDELLVVIKSVFDDKGIKKAKKETEDVGKAGKKATPTLDKLFNVFQRIGQTGGKVGQTLGVAGKALGGVAGGATLAIGAIVGLGVAYAKTMQQIERATDAMARANQQYINFARQTGLGISGMNKYASAGMGLDYNFDPSTAMQGMQNLQSNLANLRLTGEGAKPYQMLGINPMGKNAEQVIEDLRGAIQRLDDATATNFLQQMGLSPEMLPVLRMSRQEFEKMSAEWSKFTLNTDQRRQLYEYSMELKKINMQIKYLQDLMTLKIMPIMLKFKNWVRDLTVRFSHVVNLALKWGEAWNRFFTIFNPIVGLFRDLEVIFDEIDDFIVWLLGGKSVLGESIGELSEIMQKISDATPQWIKDFVNAVNKLVEFNSKNPGLLSPMLMPQIQLPARLLRMGQAFNNNANVEQNNNFYLNGGEDSQTLGERISDSALSRLQFRFGTGAYA